MPRRRPTRARTGSDERVPRDEARRPGRPAGANGDRTRERVIAAAVDIFARSGLAGASVRDIARQARIRVSTLYHYFPSKEALYREVQERAHDEIRERMLSVLGEGSDLRATASAAIGGAFDFYLANRAYAQLGYRVGLENGALGDDQRVTERWLGLVEGVLRPAVLKGLMKGVDPVLFMVTVDALLHWHIVNDCLYRHLLGRGLDDPEIARRTREHVIQVALRTVGLD
ncbi:MAG: TetR/AcrR family transcriptional regulator [Candidatus Binatia bacterium]